MNVSVPVLFRFEMADVSTEALSTLTPLAT
jgi:hypothetical protein